MKSEFKKMFPGLRLKAEELLKANPPRNTVAQLSEAEALKLLHELDVYQIELDMQNDEFAIAKELYTSTLRLAQEQDIQKIELEMQKAALAEARLELSESALQYAEFYDNAASGFFTLSNEGEILELNLYGAKLLGKQKERLIKARFGFFVSNKTKPIFSQFIERIFESFEKETCEVEIISENRNPVFCQITGISIDNIEKCLLTITDISERKELEMSLAENKERLELAMMAGEMAWWEMEISTGNVTFDSRKTEMLGYLAKDFTHSTQFTALVHPDDLDAAMKSMHRHIIGEADKYEVDYRILTKSGEYVWFNDIGAKSQKSGDEKSQYVRGIVTNISLKKEKEFAIHESEKKYRNLVDYSPDAIAIYSDGKIVFANNECVHLLAANSVEDILGKSVIDFVHPDYRSLVIKRMKNILKNSQILPLTEEKFIKFDGTTVDVEVKALPLLMDNKQAIQLIVRDITQRKQAELAQKESFNRLQKIASCVLGVVFQYKLRPDGTSCFPFSSEAITNIYHVTPEDVKEDASKVFERIHPDDLKGVAASIQYSADNLTHWQYEYRVKFEDGSIRHLLGDSIPQLEDDGSILWHGYISDITERKLSEEKLRESDQQFRDMFEKNTAVKLIVDPDSGLIIKANFAAGIFYGYSINELEKMNIGQINMLTTNEIRAEMAIASEGNSTCFNFKHRLATGEIRDVEVYSGPFEIDGKLLLNSIVHDITNRKRAELELININKRLESIVEGAHVGTWEWNIQTGETIFNDVWAQLFGYTLDELAPVSIKTWDKLAHPEDLKKSEILLNRHFSGELPFYECECRAKHKNGNWIWINDCGRVITRSEDGKPLMMFGTHTDISNRKRVEEALHLSQEELKKFASHLQQSQDEERIVLAREIHDELAQTLIAVKIDMGLLKQKVLKNAENIDISDILIKFDQLFGLVNYTIKTTGNIMTGLRPEALYLLGLIEAISLHINKFSAKYQIDCQFDNSVENLVVNTQQSLALFRILQEALENVSLHSRAKTVKIKLSTENNNLVLEIIDNGIGFDDRILEKSETFGIIGMKERARFVNGEFTIAGILDNGTTIRVEIPYK